MKNGFIAMGKSIAYFAVYFLTQIIVSIAFGIGLTAKLTMEFMESGEELDTSVMMIQVSEEIFDHAMLMTFIAGILTLFIYWLVCVIRKKKFTKEKLHKFVFGTREKLARRRCPLLSKKERYFSLRSLRDVHCMMVLPFFYV